MATPKQTREAIRRIIYHRRQLQAALTHAHDIGVIEYEREKYQEEGPCASLWEMQERVEKTTKEAIYHAYMAEVRETLK